jgi:exonuclease SbcD
LYLRQKTPPLAEERIAALLAAADELLNEGDGMGVQSQ